MFLCCGLVSVSFSFLCVLERVGSVLIVTMGNQCLATEVEHRHSRTDSGIASRETLFEFFSSTNPTSPPQTNSGEPDSRAIATARARIGELEREAHDAGEAKGFTWALKSEKYRVGVFIGCALAAAQQLTGVNLIVTQSNEIFEEIVDDPGFITGLTVAIAAINVVMTLVAIPLIERMGRKLLLHCSAAGATFTMFVVLVCVIFDGGQKNIVPAMLIMFMMSFAIGWGPVVWIYLSEIYPAAIKGACSSAATTVNWAMAVAVIFGLGMLKEHKVRISGGCWGEGGAGKYSAVAMRRLCRVLNCLRRLCPVLSCLRRLRRWLCGVSVGC